MYFVKSYFAFVFALLFIKSENAISQSKKNVTSVHNSIENIQDSSIEYKVAAYFVDKDLMHDRLYRHMAGVWNQ